MNFHTYRPKAGLHPYVKHYYYWRDDTRGAISLPQHLLSLGDQYMIFLRQGEVSCQPSQHASFTLPEAVVVGHFTCSCQLRVSGPVSMVIVQLNACGCYRLLGVSTHTFSNYYRNLNKHPDTAWQQLASQLTLAGAGEVPALLDVALGKIMQQQSHSLQRADHIADFLQQQYGQVSMTQLARQFGLSRPTLERIFMEVVGLPPRLYARMLRFKKAMRLLQQMRLPQWLAAMDRKGHYNEHMFIADYLYFNGQPPSFFPPSGPAAVTQLPGIEPLVRGAVA